MIKPFDKEKEMEVKDFVAVTLIQIIDGVKLSQEHAAKTGALINPGGINLTAGTIGYFYTSLRHRLGQSVEFDVVVTTLESDQTGGKIRVSTGILNVGVHGNSGDQSTATNGIRFTVPLVLP